MGSSRDWAAKGTKLLGIRAVIAESYERIHRSNLVGMGVLPFKFEGKEDRKSLKLLGSESINILDIAENLKPQGLYNASIKYSNGNTKEIKIRLLVNTVTEIEYLETGGILQFVFKNLVNA